MIKEFLLNDEAIRDLRALCGQIFISAGGENLDDYALAESIVIKTREFSVLVGCELVVSDFEGFNDDYPILYADKVQESETVGVQLHRVASSALTGNVIDDVIVLRETISLTRNGQRVWDKTSDIGVVLKFGQAGLAFVNLTDFDIVCKLTFHPKFRDQDLHSTRMLSDEEPENVYSYHRQLLSLGGGNA